MTNAELEQLFPLGPDSLPQPGVPQGRMEKHAHATSRIFPGTVRDYWIYVPAQYDAAQPACVTIVQDGEAHFSPERRWRIPTILDNLIHRGAIPVTIGIFINPGVIPATREGTPERHQRSFEYDSPTDRYARFLIEEILPAVATRYALRTDPDSRLILGGSSGAFCSFNAAWHRPDAFRRVFSCVGSYVGLRGGHNAAPLVRLAEPKPLRLFLEGGDDDLNVYAGDWWTANTDMLSALRYAGYEVNHAFAAKAGHNDYHGSSIFPAALRWLWQDYPQPVRAGIGSRQPITSLTVPGESWIAVSAAPDRIAHLASAPNDDLYLTRKDDARLHRLSTAGQTSIVATTAAPLGALACSTDGRIFVAQPAARRIIVLDAAGRELTTITDLVADSFAVGTQGELHVVSAASRELWLIRPDGRRELQTHSIARPHRAATLAGGAQLIVSEAETPVAWQFSVSTDGTLTHGEANYRFIQPSGVVPQPAGDIAVHPKRWTFFVSAHGLQLAEHDGRIIGLFDAPAADPLGAVALTGTPSTALYVTSGGRLFRRPLRDPENLWH